MTTYTSSRNKRASEKDASPLAMCSEFSDEQLQEVLQARKAERKKKLEETRVQARADVEAYISSTWPGHTLIGLATLSKKSPKTYYNEELNEIFEPAPGKKRPKWLAGLSSAQMRKYEVKSSPGSDADNDDDEEDATFINGVRVA